VRLGPRVGDLYPVIAGLAAGERVVTEGAFTLDADLQIRGGTSMMTLGDDSTEGPFDRAIETPAAWDAGLRPAIEAYLAMHERLADDDLEGAKAAARALAGAISGFSPTEPAPAVEAWQPLARHLVLHAESAAEGASLEAVRADFEALGQRVIALLRTFGNPTRDPLRLAFCPMAGSGGAEWIQTSETIANPYFGRAMHTCGSIRQTAPPGSHLPSPVESVEREAPRRPAAGGHAH
jgi:Cu(I)/Ag(I) efflux system membrane fusion protein